MEIEHNKTNKKIVNDKQNKKKDLLRLQKPIYELKKSQQNQADYVIRKLMMKKEKPQIGMVGRSSLLSKLEQMMPIFKKSNEEILTMPIPDSLKIDAKLQQCISSDSESQHVQDQSQQKPISRKINDMQVQHQQTYNASEEMEDEQNSLEQELEINFIRYPYLMPEQLNELQEQKLTTPTQKIEKKKPLIEEILSESTK